VLNCFEVGCCSAGPAPVDQSRQAVGEGCDSIIST
jgi:hypothetical protein